MFHDPQLVRAKENLKLSYEVFVVVYSCVSHMIQRIRFKQFSSVFLVKLKMGLDPVALNAVRSKTVVLLLLSHCLLLLQLFVVFLSLVLIV